ncbi:hypothetical protein [Streptomyces sp. NPDC059949]|uniref:hypothetical protein n=1 Tax=Streptomyces sp. NPDC059949 TaxID=3347013 RepID=UPI00365FCFEF
MASVPTPQTFFPGEKVTAAKLNTSTKTVQDFILNPPRCMVGRSVSNVSVPTGTTGIAIPWDLEIADTDSMWTAAAPTRITIKTAGVYAITGNVGFLHALSGWRNGSIHRNGALEGMVQIHPVQQSNHGTHMTVAMELRCAVNDYIELWAKHTTTGSPLDIAGGSSTGVYNNLSVRWVAL